MNGEYKVTILWGQIPEDNKPITYSFDTEKELNAFMYGVDETVGWLDYEIIEE